MIPITPQALQAYTNAGKVGGPGLDPRGDGSGFADMVKSAASDVADTLEKGEAASAKAIAGGGNLTEVVTAVSNAEATLQTVVAVRDRVIQAYQDILKMPI
jgi:flagellar hook-basal body complex protein FliE